MKCYCLHLLSNDLAFVMFIHGIERESLIFQYLFHSHGALELGDHLVVELVNHLN